MARSWVQRQARNFVLGALSRIHNGRLTIISKYPGADSQTSTFGEQLTKDNNENFGIAVVVKDPNAWTRLCQAFDLGFAEAYMLQEVECDSLVGLFQLYLANRSHLGFSGNFLYRLLPLISKWVFSPTNNLTHARLNASFHYDTSNDLFSAFLSPDMNYSSALWSGEPDESLESAQQRKIHNIIEKAQISSSDHVLDIGCGWGYFAMEAVRTTGCRVTGITLSSEQKSLAEKRIQAAGLQDRIDIVLCDYRKAPFPEGGYDKITSIEMLEHVGDKYMNGFFEAISNYLKPVGGIMVIQGITNVNLIHDNMPPVDTFIDRYIFPGGYLPTVNQLVTSIHTGSKGSLEVESVQNIGPHYIRTLQCWKENFEKNWAPIRVSFVEKHKDATEEDIEAFRRRWLYYFMYCEAGFRMRILNDFVISAVRTPWIDIPSNVPH
ncbi:Mycolic acid cyclopropane synthetase-domain-containing protein [Xylogone sp. PMI_703]|nr:Mycolic acid cyclopropane synthetase-domain-containing protein [Xylogone sp. PMI_703]